MPHSHNMAANISVPKDEKMPIETIMKYIMRGAYDSLNMFASQFKKLLTLYFIFTILCLGLDFTCFSITVKHFGTDSTTIYSDMSLVIISSIYLFLDWFYILWIISFLFKVPSYITTEFIYTTLGLVGSLTGKLN